ncbi:hypothetical protein RF679_11215 [Undibacterium cyanobacteriorum]|uniref:Uridine kinase n=1 Tax=Undibacterium cyanobacteriorum TaxID=3073561 RepID=A0ABY9RE28_9BURK|nr:hypothetical protein [Undibacterium sp. 20NA77.5]WMW79216.1 hypothetical protein RF679_11215 [Undibacterium sp. 20NA77.5]
MPIRPSDFDRVAAELEQVLTSHPAKVVAIDGRSGSGKTTLGRFLAWYFNSSLVELDLFLAEGGLVHREPEIDRIIGHRLALRRPVFIEGLKVLSVLEALQKPPDILIYVRNPKHPRGFGFGSELDEYEQTFQPQQRANIVLECEHGL